MEEVGIESAIDERTSARANKIGLLLGGIGAGLLLMYLLDPNRGRGRRAKLKDQLTSKARRLGREAESKTRDLRNRAQGLLHETGLVGSERRRAGSLQSDRGYEPMEQGT
jgi:hypothetical protein